MKQKLPTKVTINGVGDSLWGPSRGAYDITDYSIDYLDYDGEGKEEPYELRLFGEDTKWFHYTDSQIQADVNRTLLQFLQDHVDSRIMSVTWSEQGMQPAEGWSFDINIPS